MNNNAINNSDIFNVIVILGPTASGKTRIAAKLARSLGGEIISADSRQVYRGLDIGTGKDRDEYNVDGIAVPVHLIDVVDPDTEFNLFDYRKLFFQCARQIIGRQRLPFMVGGTGLYIESVILNYKMQSVPLNQAFRHSLQHLTIEELRSRLVELNPRLHNTTDLLHRDRLIRAFEIAEYSKDHSPVQEDVVNLKPIVFGLRWERSVIRQRITKRLQQRLEQGLIDEVRDLHVKGIEWEKFDFLGLEYRYVTRYLRGLMTYKQLFIELNSKIHQFAKRQETWFRRMEKKGVVIHWVEGDDLSAIQNSLNEYIDEIRPKLS